MRSVPRDDAVLEVRDLTVTYAARKARRGDTGGLTAVNGVSLKVPRARTLGLVGESGCGKSTLGRTLIGYQRAVSGSITFDGLELRTLSRREWKPVRARLQMVFQDPYASLNPSFRVRDLIAEPLRVHGRYGRDADRLVREMARRVGLEERALDRYPRQFSGGQRQRIGIARALMLNPELLILDEPVSALDVSVQAQIISLLQDLQDELGLSYVFIAHDLSVVRHISHEIAVMQAGRIVERGPAASMFAEPRHPYTRTLLASIPVSDPRRRRADAPSRP